MSHSAPPKNVQEILPLSPTQEGMLFEILREPDAVGRYDSVQSVTLEGPLDPASFRQVFEEVALAPDVSRACFVHDSGVGPVQIIRKTAALPFEVHDWSGRADFAEAAASLEAKMLAEPLALTKAPLMAAVLLRQGPERHVLLWRVHHMISDAWSANVVLEDVLARINGNRGAAPGPAFREHLARWKGRDREADRAFFKDYLSGIGDDVLLAGGTAPGLGQSGRMRRAIPRAQTAAFAALARSERTTLATALFLAWGLCLRRLTGKEDVLFGRVAAGRDPAIPGIDRAVGPYLNVVPTRLGIEGPDPVRAALARAEASLTQLRRSETAALADALSGLDRAIETRLPFDTLVSVQGFAAPQSAGPLRVAGTKTTDATGFPLALVLCPGDEIEAELVYDPHRLPERTVGQIAEMFSRTIAAMAETPDAPISQLPGLACAPISPVPTADFVHLDILARGQTQPDAIAIKTPGVALSYGALASQVAAVARSLAEAKVGPGDIVPIIAERQASTLVAMLAVLSVGAAYAPIDPDYPADRNRLILDDLSPPLVVGDAPLPGWDGPLLTLSDARAQAREGDVPRPVQVQGDDPAYVIFTSGSTGRPKGVVVTHANLAWSTSARGPVYGAGPKVFLHLSSFAFDSSVVGLYWTLTSGGTLFVAPPRAEQDPAALGALMAAEGVSHLLCLPRLWSALLSAGAPAPDLETVIVAGEEVGADLPRQHRGAAPGVRLFNEYGPTEATVWCAAAEITQCEGAPPIGAAPPGAALEPCDLDGGPLPQGLQGELVVRGHGVAKGYLSGEAGGFVQGAERAYRTGDLGTVDSEGLIHWQGRKDDQVKIRGHRIELGEIEAAALAAGAQGAAAAVAEGRIILAVTGAPEDMDQLLAGRLAEAARPAAIHHLGELPRTPNQKIDRKAIAALGLHKAAEAEASQSYTEGLLTEIWSRILMAPVDRRTHFFDAGGDSLMTIRVLAEAERRGLVLRPSDMFDTPVLGQLAAVVQDRLEQPLAHEADLRLSLANPQGTLPPVLMIHGSPKFNAAIAAAFGPDRPFIFNWSHHLAGEVTLSDRIETMADEALAALMRIRPDGPCCVGGFSLGAIVALEVAHRLKALGRPVTLLAMVDPSYDIAPPGTVREPWDILAKRWIGAAKSLAQLALGRLRGWGRQRRTPHVYRAILPFYRPQATEAPSLVLQNTIKPRNGLALDAILPTAQRESLPYSHLQLLDDRDAIADVAARIVAEVRRLEREPKP